ncbi:phage tail tape measure protein [Insolitispirillum peregrinum]|uniref:Phage tail tape measure protein, TP901 family, core region n=1 Tax=Insolitispirillum peregrinum TaxID=80876 RepID=A0A1N7JL37_9PROT|nr:hypothetical protein [Insolitispirillum peregrinum]SIS49966.1 hypothetical protein SAMN05421779_102360 [Insolitispirillum peregrinum]
MSSNRPSGANDGGESADFASVITGTKNSFSQLAASGARLNRVLQAIELSITASKFFYEFGARGIQSLSPSYDMVFDLKMDSREAPHLYRNLNNLGDANETNLPWSTISGIGQILANDDIDEIQLRQGVRGVGRTEQATQVPYETAAQAARKAHDDLKVAYNDIEEVLGVLHDMGDPDDLDFEPLLNAIPNLSQLAENIGMKDKQGLIDLGAALKEAGTLTDTPVAASTMVSETLKSLNSATTQDAFKAAGIDLKARLAEGRAQNLSEFTVAAQAVHEVAGDDPKKRTALLNSPQAEMLLSRIGGKDSRLQELRSHKPDEQNTIGALYKRRRENPKSNADAAENARSRLGRAIDMGFKPFTDKVNQIQAPLLNDVAQFVESIVFKPETGLSDQDFLDAKMRNKNNAPVSLPIPPREKTGTSAPQNKSKAPISLPMPPPATEKPHAAGSLAPGDAYDTARSNAATLTPVSAETSSPPGPQSLLDPNRPLLADPATKGKVDVSITFANAPPAAISTRSDSPQVTVSTQIFSAALGPSMNGPV